MSEISDLVARLLAAGAAADVAAVVVVEAFDLGVRTSAEFRRQSVESPTDAAAQRRRNADKQRKREARAAARLSKPVCGQSADSADKRCDLFLVKEESSNREVSKKSEIEAPAPRRGTRLQSKVPLSETDRKFAVENGVRNPDRLWVEFVDYWVGIPGQRGVKLDWSATWRNRVRQVGTGKSAPTNFRDPTAGII